MLLAHLNLFFDPDVTKPQACIGEPAKILPYVPQKKACAEVGAVLAVVAAAEADPCFLFSKGCFKEDIGPY